MGHDISFDTLEAPTRTQSTLPEITDPARQGAMLDQIAAVFDVPVGAFVQPGVVHDIRARVLAENAEALKIFAGMTDWDARQRGLAYLRASNKTEFGALGGDGETAPSRWPVGRDRTAAAA